MLSKFMGAGSAIIELNRFVCVTRLNQRVKCPSVTGLHDNVSPELWLIANVTGSLLPVGAAGGAVR
jgi:hypothetical protein